MKLTAKADTIKEFISIADGINALEVRVHVEEDKVWFRVVDAGNVAMVAAELPRDSFDEFTFEPGSFCIDMVKFKAVFGFGGKDIIITRESAESNAITIESGGYKAVQTLLHDGTVKKDPNMPELSLDGKVEMNGKEFSTALKNINAGGFDKLRLVVSSDTFTIASAGEGQEKVEKPYSSDDILHVSGEGNSLFSFDYLLGMARNWGGDIKVSVGVDMPVIVESSIAGGHGSAKFLLAPRLEEGV